jgi:chromosomal replication initiator protein
MAQSSTDTWDKILAIIESKLPRESFLTWFGPLKCLSIENGTIEVGIPNRFFYGFLETHYREHILAALAEVGDGKLKIHYQIMQEGDREETPPPAQTAQSFKVEDVRYDERTQLNPRYTYENFVEGDGNSFAKAAALAVSEAPGKTPFNPLFVYGATGLGKTHLIQALGNFSLAHHKTDRIIYVTSEKFMNDFIFSIKAYKTTDFSRFYRSVDLLLLDDIQFFQGKERTQLEFFHTFNSLYQAGKQIVLSSDRPPRELDDFDKRLISRIGWGLVTDIHPPDFETRLAILQKRAEREGIFISEDIAEYLANQFKENIRDLEGALIRLVAHGSIAGTDLTLALAKDVLRDQIRTPDSTVSIDLIQKKVAEFYQIPADLLIARTRKKEVARARQISMYLCTEMTNSSLQSIGLHFGNRDHSTVIHARNIISKEIAEAPGFSQEIDSIKSKLSTP